MSFTEFIGCSMRNTILEDFIANEESLFANVDLTGATGFVPGNIPCGKIILPNGEFLEDGWEIFERKQGLE